MVEVVTKIWLTGSDIALNPHDIASWLLMEVRRDIHMHIPTKLLRFACRLLADATSCAPQMVAFGESNIGPSHIETHKGCKMLVDGYVSRAVNVDSQKQNVNHPLASESTDHIATGATGCEAQVIDLT